MHIKPKTANTNPDSINAIEFSDIFNLDEIQHFQDMFSGATGVASIITHPNGIPITKPSNFCRLCNHIIRDTEKGRSNCYQSDAILGRLSSSGPVIQPCLSGGLWDAGAGISVGGKNIANWLIGQVRNEDSDIGYMLQYADEIGANRQDFMDALEEVPVMSLDQFTKVSELLYHLANQLSDTANKKWQMKLQRAEPEESSASFSETIAFTKPEEERFRRMVEYSSDILVHLDESGVQRYISPSARQITGFTVEELKKPFTTFIHPDDLAKVQSVFEEILHNPDRIVSGDYRHIHKNGTYRYFEAIGRNFVSDPAINGIVVNIRDVTDRKLSEIALREKDHFIHGIAENSPNIIYLYSVTQGRNIYTNRSISKLLGYAEDELTDDDPYFFERQIYPDDLTQFEQFYKRIDHWAENQVFDYEYRILTKSGEWRWFKGSEKEFERVDGQVISLIGNVSDVTEQKKLELQHEQQLFFTFALNEIAEVIISNDQAEDILKMANRIIGETLELDRALIYDVSFEKQQITGLCEWIKQGQPDIEATLGIYPIDLFINPFTQIRKSHIHLESHFDEVNEHFTGDGSGKMLHGFFKIKSLIWYPFAFYEHGYYVFTINQILEKREWTTEEIGFLESVAKQVSLALMKIKLLDELKQNEKELLLLNEQLDLRVRQRTAELVEANKELETFSYSVSHDLKAPLRHIQGFIDLFLEHKVTQLTPDEHGYLTTISESASEMAKLIDAILKLSKLNQAKLRKTTIHSSAMVHEVINFFTPELKNRKIDFHIEPLPDIQGDEGFMRQVWTNLISNAIKYTGKQAEAVIEIGSSSEDDMTTFFIRDNGAGFNMKYVSKLYGVFQRLHKSRDFDGIGIGLANVERIIRKHGGYCSAVGEPDKGATFSFTLPDLKKNSDEQ